MSNFRAALAQDPGDAYAKGAFADFLLDAGRHAEVVALLDGDTRNDALLLRLAQAEKALSATSERFRLHAGWLADRFAAARRRGDDVNGDPAMGAVADADAHWLTANGDPHLPALATSRKHRHAGPLHARPDDRKKGVDAPGRTCDQHLHGGHLDRVVRRLSVCRSSQIQPIVDSRISS